MVGNEARKLLWQNRMVAGPGQQWWWRDTDVSEASSFPNWTTWLWICPFLLTLTVDKSLNGAEPQLPNLKNGNMNNHLVCLLWKPKKIKYIHVQAQHPGNSVFCVSFLLFWDLSVPPSEGSPTWRAGLKNPVQAFPVIRANFLSLEWKNFWGFIHQGKTIFHRELSLCWLLCHQAVWSWTSHSTSETLFSHLQKEVSVSIQLCMPGGKLKVLTYKVTTWPGLSRSAPVFSCCPSIIINSSVFHCQKWAGLDNKLFGQSVHPHHHFSRRSS